MSQLDIQRVVISECVMMDHVEIFSPLTTRHVVSYIWHKIMYFYVSLAFLLTICAIVKVFGLSSAIPPTASLILRWD